MFTVTATAQCILILNVCLEQWRNYNFWAPGKHSLHSLITVLVHNSGSLWTPFTVLGPCPPRHCRGCRWIVTPLVWNGSTSLSDCCLWGCVKFDSLIRCRIHGLRRMCWVTFVIPQLRAIVYIFLFKHQRQRAQATYMPVKSSTMNTCMLNNDTK